MQIIKYKLVCVGTNEHNASIKYDRVNVIGRIVKGSKMRP